MTEFGRLYLRRWLLVRFALLAFALGILLVSERFSPEPVLVPFVVLLVADMLLSLLSRPLFARFETAQVVYAFILLDTVLTAAAVFYSGGLEGGYAAIYVAIILSALLLLGRRAALQFAVYCIAALVVQFLLDLAGIRYFPNRVPILIQFVGQFGLLIILIVIAFVLARANRESMEVLRGEKSEAEKERAAAEHIQQRWALINSVALRIQESTTPQQVYTSIGEEVERLGLHCALLEWTEPNVSMHITYLSLTGQTPEQLRAQFRVGAGPVLFKLADKPDLTYAVQTREPILLRDPNAASEAVFPNVPKELRAQLLQKYEVVRLIFAPMLLGERVTAVLGIFGKTLDDQDLAPFAALAQQAASALEKARLLTEERKRRAQLELASSITARIGTAENVEQMLQPLVQDINQRFGYAGVCLFRVDEPHLEFFVQASCSTLSSEPAANVRVPITRGILGQVMRTGETYLARDVHTDPYYHTPRPATDPIHSELVVPLRGHDRIIGALDFESTQVDGFDASDVAALTLIADQISAALTRAQTLALEKKRAAQLALVGEIAARAAAFAEPDEILRTMVQLVQQRFGFHHVCVSLYDPIREELELRAVAGENVAFYTIGQRWRATGGLIGLAAQSRKTVLSGDVHSDPRYFPDADEKEGANSELCVPLLSGKTVAGVLDVEKLALHAFDENDIAAMETLANQMAAALEKARSLQAERRRAAQLALVNRIASRTARLQPTPQLLREAVELIHAQFGYFNVSVLMAEHKASGSLSSGSLTPQNGASATAHSTAATAVHTVANAGMLNKWLKPENSRLTRGVIVHAAASGNTYLCTNTAADPHYISPFPEGTPDPVRSEIAIPLRRGEYVIGVLDIQSEQENAFSPNDITALEALADQLATALENARLFESEAQRVAELDTVRVLALKLTAEHDLDSLLESIVSSAAELVQAEGAGLYIVDETRGDLVARISQNFPNNYVGYRLRFGEGLAGRVAASGEPMLIADYAAWKERAEAFETEPLARMMSVPLKWQDRVLGVLNLHRSQAGRVFNQEELRLTSLLVAQAAIALENARLLNALQGRLHAQQALTDISGTLLQISDPQAIIYQAAAAALAALDSETAIVFLPDDAGHLVAQAHDGIVSDALLNLHLPADASSIPGEAYSSRHPRLWSDSDPGTLTHVNPLAHRIGFRAGISVPMLVGDRAMGVITVNTHRERHYTASDVQTLSLLANQTASALERARYFDQLQRRVRELNLLFEGYRAATFTLEPDLVIAHVLEQLVHALDLTSAYFVTVDQATGELSQEHEYFSEFADETERVVTARTLKPDELPEIRLVLAQNVQVTNASDPNLSEEMRAYMRENRVYTILRVPLVAADEMLGYVSLWETRAARIWTLDETRFVQTLASQAAAALANARLYQAAQTHARELQALYEASRSLNASLDVQAICENSADSLRDILGYQHVSIYLVEDNALHLQVQRGYDIELDYLPLTRGVMARAVTNRHVMYLSDVSVESDYVAALPGVQSEIAVPLMLGERVLGVLNVETVHNETASPRREQLTPADVQLLSTFGNQLVVAIENARLFQETQRRLAQVRTLHAASQAVNADLEIEVVLERVAREFLTALSVSSCTLCEWDHTHDEIVILYDYDPEPRAQVEVGARYPLTEIPDAVRTLSDGKTRALRLDEAASDDAGHTYLEKYVWKSALIVPLRGRGRVTGFIELGDRARLRSFNADEIQLAESLAGQAAVALENARLYADAQKRLHETETLYHFARELSATLNIRELGKRALEAAARLTDFDIGEVCLIRESDGILIPFVFTGTADLVPLTDAIPRGEGILGWVAEHGHSARVGDVTRDPRYRAISSHILSEICLPLRIGERIIGVLNLEAKAPDAFSEHVEQLLTVFANQLAIAVENARLYEQTKRDADVKAALLRELSHRVKNNLAAITSLLYMALDEPPETREQILNETLGRVQSMAIAHTLLAHSNEAHVNLLELGRQVLSDTVRNITQPGAHVTVEVGGERVNVAARQTTTLALVLNELATNALRHGLTGTGSLEMVLRFEVAQSQREVEFHLLDNGMGLPPEFDMQASAGLGLNLVRTLVEKDLHGHFTLGQRDNWTCAEVRFRLEEDIL